MATVKTKKISYYSVLSLQGREYLLSNNFKFRSRILYLEYFGGFKFKIKVKFKYLS